MTLQEITALLTQHVAALNEPDKGRRTLMIAEVYAEALQFIDPLLEFTGRAHLNGFVKELHQQNPGYVFRMIPPIEAHHNLARMNWQFGPEENPTAIAGQDIAVLANGRIQTLYIFVDGVTPQS